MRRLLCVSWGALGALIALQLEGCAGSAGQPPVTRGPSSAGIASAPRPLASSGTTYVFVRDYNGTHVVGFSGPPFGLPFFDVKPLPSAGRLVHNSAGDVFIGGAFEIYEYRPPYTGAAKIIPSALSPINIAFDANDNLYAATPTGVERCAAPYTSGCAIIVPPPSMNGAAGGPRHLAVAPDGTVFGMAHGIVGPEWVEYLRPPYSGSPGILANSQDSPSGLATDMHGNVFTYVSLSSPKPRAIVREYAPPYTSLPIVNAQNAIPMMAPGKNGSMLFDTHGDLFVAGFSAIKEYAPPYRGSPIATVNIHSDGWMALDTANILYADNKDVNQIFYYPPPYTSFGQHIHRNLNYIYDVTAVGP